MEPKTVGILDAVCWNSASDGLREDNGDSSCSSSIYCLCMGSCNNNNSALRIHAIYEPELFDEDEYQPNVMIIVTKNESSGNSTARALGNLDYPKDKISVIMVNDGSDDDTGVWMDKISEDYGYEVIHLERNIGKRSDAKQ